MTSSGHTDSNTFSINGLSSVLPSSWDGVLEGLCLDPIMKSFIINGIREHAALPQLDPAAGQLHRSTGDRNSFN